MVLPVPGILWFEKEKSKVIEIRKIMLIVVTIAAMVAAGTMLSTTVGTARAQSAGANPESKQKERNLVAGEAEAKRLLLLMDRDQSGKVSKKEFMTFMEEEFQRLDVNKDGELDVEELTRSRLTPHVGTHR
jgi:hypothetical protein